MTWATLPDLNDGDILTGNHMDQIRGNIEYLSTPNSSLVYDDSEGDYFTTSTAFVEVSPDYVISLNCRGGLVRCMFAAQAWNANDGLVAVDLEIDGVRYANWGLQGLACNWGSQWLMLGYVVSVSVAAGVRQFRPVWRVNGGTGYLRHSSSAIVPIFQVVDLP